MELAPTADQPSTISIGTDPGGYVRLWLEDPTGAFASSFLTPEESRQVAYGLLETATTVEFEKENDQ